VVRGKIQWSLQPLTETALFRHSEQAHRDLEQLRARLPAGLFSAAVVLLAECADPAQALNLLERLTRAENEALIRLFDKNRILLHYVLTIFGQSYWLGETIAKDPGILQALGSEKHLERSFGHEDVRQNLEDLRSRSSETNPSTLLAGFKKREYIRIILRDVLSIATLAETTAELSALADVIVECALKDAERQVRSRFDPPAHPRQIRMKFAVLALGKLGGNELNYSSDLDLLYIFDSSGSTMPPDAFTLVARIVTDILCRATPEGPVFRVDLRLRPQGSEGELVTSLQKGIEYYSRDAADWELQAMIKLRYSAGDQSLARAFITGVQARVYTPNLNFAALDTALRSRERLTSRHRPRGLRSADADAVDVKLDRGGIRDIEFLVQCLQRVYGGEEKWLRSGGTLFSLQKLHDKGHISGKDFHDLTQAYEFLRRLEHRLQLQRGQQLHRLPAEQDDLLILQRAMAAGGSTDKATDLTEQLQSHMENVSAIYDRIIFSQKRKEKHGGAPPLPAASSVREMSYEQVLERIALDSSPLHEIVARTFPLHTRRNLHRFLSSAMTSAERYAELLKNPVAVKEAIILLSLSEYLTDILVRHPDVIRVLDSMDAVRDRPQTNTESKLVNQQNVDPAHALDTLRHWFRRASFATGARDVLTQRSAFESMAETSALADEAIRDALSIVQGQDILAVFALGRLGTSEFDVASDADLLFLRSSDTDAVAARISAEKLIHALAAYTREGSLFAMDARLRPHGNEGELVITPAQLEGYLADEAQPWEALTYTKLRFVAGREELGPPVLAMAQRRILELASWAGFPRAVMEMRTRLEKSNRYAHSFKLARGGFYDIDFIASFLMLRNASLYLGNTLARLEHLHRSGVMQTADFEDLRDATMLYRTADHLIRLVTGRARPELPEAEHARAVVEDLVHTVLRQPRVGDLQQKLNVTAEKVRSIFRRILQS
jgi:glutamate-ammonia-ligase adenylyltransferase